MIRAKDPLEAAGRTSSCRGIQIPAVRPSPRQAERMVRMAGVCHATVWGAAIMVRELGKAGHRPKVRCFGAGGACVRSWPRCVRYRGALDCQLSGQLQQRPPRVRNIEEDLGANSFHPNGNLARSGRGPWPKSSTIGARGCAPMQTCAAQGGSLHGQDNWHENDRRCKVHMDKSRLLTEMSPAPITGIRR